MDHNIRKVTQANGIVRVITTDSIKRKLIPLNFLHEHYASADGRIWKRRNISPKSTDIVWKEIVSVKATQRHKSGQVFIRDKKGKHRRISKAFLVLCAFRGYAGKWFYAAHTGSREDDSLKNLKWRFRQTCTKRNKRKNISISFFDIFKDNEEMMAKYLEKLRGIDSTAEARIWNEKMLKRYEDSVNGSKEFKII